jgi:mRNA interferase MazF
MTRGKIVLVPFPFDDLTAQKARPAVCLTDPLGPHRHIVLAFITSRQPDELLASDVILDLQDPGFGETGLQVRSTLRVHRLVTVASSVIKRELGHLSPTMQERVPDAVRQLFAC